MMPVLGCQRGDPNISFRRRGNCAVRLFFNLIVRVPVKFSHVSGRRKIETSHPTEFQTNSPILRAVARGMAWLKMLDEGKVSSIHDLADTLKRERKYVRAPACAPLGPLRPLRDSRFALRQPDAFGAGESRGSPSAKDPFELRSSVHSTLRLAFLSHPCSHLLRKLAFARGISASSARSCRARTPTDSRSQLSARP